MAAPIPRATLGPGYTVSRLIKGGWQLAGGHGRVDEEVAFDDMDAFVASGITTFDCADIYTGVESLIGRYRSRRRARTALGDDIQVHTKCVPDRDRLSGLTRATVNAVIDRSASRLGVETVDLVQLHWWDYDVDGVLEVGRWLDESRAAGRIRHLGLTNFDTEHVRAFAHAGVGVVSHQVQYSLLDRRPDGDMADTCARHGIGLLAYGALAGGFLSSRWLGQPAPAQPLENRSLVKYRLIIDECGGWDYFQALLAVIDRIAGKHGVGLGAVAIRWVLERPGVAAVIVGARSRRHLPDTLSALSLTLDAEDRAAIASVQASARGPAGDVYALERDRTGPHAAIMRYDLQRP